MELLLYIQRGFTPVMLAAKNGYKDTILILTSKGANLDHVNEVSIHFHTLYYNIKKLELLYMCVCVCVCIKICVHVLKKLILKYLVSNTSFFVLKFLCILVSWLIQKILGILNYYQKESHFRQISSNSPICQILYLSRKNVKQDRIFQLSQIIY